jgi:hypothetical protein
MTDNDKTACGLHFNTDVHNFDPRAASQLRGALRKVQDSARQRQNQESFGRALNASKSLEEELLLLLAIEASDRDVQLLAKLWGCFGTSYAGIGGTGTWFNARARETDRGEGCAKDSQAQAGYAFPAQGRSIDT